MVVCSLVGGLLDGLGVHMKQMTQLMSKHTTDLMHTVSHRFDVAAETKFKPVSRKYI